MTRKYKRNFDDKFLRSINAIDALYHGGFAPDEDPADHIRIRCVKAVRIA